MVPSGPGELVRTARKPWHAPAVSVVLAFRNTAFTSGPNADFQGGNQSQPSPPPPQPPPPPQSPPPPPPPPQSKGSQLCEGTVFAASGGNTSFFQPGMSKHGGILEDASFHGPCQPVELT
jgi:hypothetical protein